ncbi:sulfatase-like hydrolase/transferase [Lewinella sp. IMCC34183]|uniref:sulfatase-like hydrolase/transferase n=1 Tax=Lewinella sp. IMCC34183 TaxID=2248762 RepID=UPI000E22C0B5|nr:sulfatase-like hydrolase/transferase [Lewinella sp. IMCC34183]
MLRSTLFLCLWCVTLHLRAAAPPNILFILADDLGYGDLGSYGQRTIRTPHLDRLAAEGTRYTRCYAGSTVCAPSRSVLMTGQHTGRTTVRGNNGVGGVVGLGGAAGRVPLRETDITVAERLQSAGYRTGMVGKWGLGEPGTSGTPDRQGFDYFFGFLNQRRAHTYFPDYVWRDTLRIDLPGNADGGRERYIQDDFLNESLAFLSRDREQPFFLYLPFTLPHDDYEIDTVGRFADSTHWTADERTYAAMVERLDRDVGLILDRLAAEGLAENTVVFFTSDNGAARRWERRFDSSGALRGHKRDMYEGGIRAPMIVRYPGHVAAGEVSDLPWSFADVLPTLCAAAGIPPVADTDGINLWPVLLGEPVTDHVAGDRMLYWEFHEGGYQQAILHGDFKAVRTAVDAVWELYDLANDPGETTDLAAERPALTDQLARQAQTAHQPSPYFPVVGKGRRKLLLIGDSTVKYGSSDSTLCGWGEVLDEYVDDGRLAVVNAARGGRSSKTYYQEGLWEAARAGLREGDLVLMQFGHNDGGPAFTGKERGSLRGVGDTVAVEILGSTGRPDTVRTYGWYLRQYIHDAQAVGAIPVVCSPVPRNRWVDGRTERAAGNYGGWAETVAREEGALFLDLNERVAKVYDILGEETLWASYFGEDHTHTTCYGARLNARTVVEGLRDLDLGLGTALRLPE